MRRAGRFARTQSATAAGIAAAVLLLLLGSGPGTGPVGSVGHPGPGAARGVGTASVAPWVEPGPSPPPEPGADASGPAIAILRAPLPCTAPLANDPVCGSGGAFASVGRAVAGRSQPPWNAPADLAALNWSNATNATGAAFAAGAGGGSAVAFDPLLDEVVLVGAGCGTGCPSGQTWVYAGSNWTNATGTLAREPGGSPPALTGAGLAWDPDWAGVVMTGGATRAGAASNETWLFNATGWHNLTAAVGTGAPRSVYAPLVYDSARHALVSVDGCVGLPCVVLRNQTATLGGPGATWTIGAGPAEPAVMGEAMAYDPPTGSVVLFGGRANTSSSLPTIATTWELNGSGEWSNVTSTACGLFDGLCLFYPPAAAFGGMTWDGQLGSIVLFGGRNLTSQFNGTWVWNGSVWYSMAWVYGNGPALAPGARSGFALDTNSSLLAPAIVGGTCLAALGCAHQVWVLEVPPEPSVVSASPDPVDAGGTLTGSVALGTGSGSGVVVTLSLASPNGTPTPVRVPYSYATNVTATPSFVYANPGNWSLGAIATDFWKVVGRSPGSLPIRVDPRLSGSVALSANPTDLVGGSAAVGFTARATGGDGTYAFRWEFGDGLGGNGSSVTHLYTSAGNFSGWLHLTDGAGGSANESFVLIVHPPVSATSSANATATDVGLPVQFQGTPVGGTTPYVTEHWTFAPGAFASGLAPVFTFGAAGSYSVAFNVTDALGNPGSAPPLSVTVNPSLEGGIPTASPGASRTGEAVTFAAPTTGGTPPLAYAWQFGDGSAGSGAAPSHRYAHAGTYAVNVTVRDQRHEAVVEHLTVAVTGPRASPLAPGTPAFYVLVAGGIAAVVAVVLLGVRRRRRRPAPGAPGPEPFADDE